MQVCLDYQAAVAQQAGVGRYTRFLAQHLAATGDGDSLRLFYFDFQRQAASFLPPGCEGQPFRWLPGRAIQGLWKTLDWPPFDRLAGRADLYHFPNFILPPLRRGPGVVTIHDMSFFRFPAFTEARNLAFLTARIRNTARRAAGILTDSRFSAAEIRELLGVPADRVFAVPLGVTPNFCPPAPGELAGTRTTLGLDRPYLLCVGTLEPRKNHLLAIAAFEQLRGYDGDLVIAGMPGWKCEPILAAMRESPRAARIRYLRYVPEAQLPALYAGADLLVFPSHYEGFGLPPLEAMACGTPVLSSDAASLPEVLGAAAAYLPPADPAAWADAIERSLADTQERARRIAAGFAQAARFTWADTARATWSVYREIAG